MPHGMLEVILISAKGLHNSDFLLSNTSSMVDDILFYTPYLESGIHLPSSPIHAISFFFSSPLITDVNSFDRRFVDDFQMLLHSKSSFLDKYGIDPYTL
ncbi:hypothetical protein MTR_7g075963 [Medicago truncatula]|uniref:Uncharacterized protein n=1 Tax=Medicago truncatula TaxID=3880 RepID=A0A072U1N8_MEDTR|nr:hypothetical protein MTR_7g075963 [Medicago truncatula]